MTIDDRRRWLALIVLCCGNLMIVLDTTIVNVALPSIREDLGFSETSLAWVVNAYLLTFGGFLLLGGRLGDLFGHRRMFLGGVTLFTLASVSCGLATSQAMLVAARAVQGLGGAVVSAVALSLIMSLFTDAGNVYEDTEFEADDLRYSAGVAFQWLSPVGALAFSLAQPFGDQEGDELESFQFTLGAPF